MSTPSKRIGVLTAYITTLLYSLMNPFLILSFSAIFASLGLVSLNTNYYSAIILIAGVFSGSALWWFVLVGIVRRLSVSFNEKIIKQINHASGALMFCFGVMIFGSIIFLHT
jgi:arginine exporter protein ArgO